MKHLGAFLNDSADYWPDTRKHVQAGFFAVRRIAKLWSLGTARGRGNNAGLNKARKLRVMCTVLEGNWLVVKLEFGLRRKKGKPNRFCQGVSVEP